jgi:hypothetical protein
MQCIACKSEIPDAASICKECNSYQQTWRNWIPFDGTGVALLTVILAGMSYVWHVFSKQLSEWTAKDGIQIAYLNSRGATSYLNTGDNGIVLMNENLTCFGLSVGRGINQRVAKSDFVTFGEVQGWGVNQETFLQEKPESSRQLLFFDNGNIELQQLREAFPSLRTFPAKGSVTFFSTHDKKQKEFQFNCVCIIVQEPPTASGRE